MAIYRNVSLTFWEDNKVVDEFTPSDKYFLLYLLTNPHTNLIGCYEVSIKQMSNELGYEKSKVEELLTRMEHVHKIILYAEETKEVLIKNWHKYNWNKSKKLIKPIEKDISKIKNEKLKKYMVSIWYRYRMDTTDTVTVPVTDTDTVTDTDISNITSIIEQNFGRTIGSLEVEVVKSWISDNISEELIVYAIKISVCNNACSIKYVDAILQSWKRKGITTVLQAKEDNDNFKNKKVTKNAERDKWENE